ncbi:MAG TPA: lysophospholipid acyltransferase family protein [Pseudonocardiaceae bacterium]|nr:lysophospholipid acyltransferase family protein [Pseudonocardiaceae bacterium]
MSHAWMPTSPCGPDCHATTTPTVGGIRSATRLIRAALVLMAALALAPLLIVLRGRSRAAMLRWVFTSMLGAFGAKLEIHGDVDFARAETQRGALVVQNHVSWLDIVVANAVRPMRSVAKREIGEWPLVGALATKAGTVYLDRESLRALPGTVTELSAALRGGAQVNVCPEGTTWCGLAAGHFRPALFQAAIDGGVPVRPLAVRYRLSTGQTTTWPSFVGTETLIDSVRRTAKLRGLVIEVHVLDEIAPGRADTRAELASLAETQIAAILAGPHIPAQRRAAHVRMLAASNTDNDVIPQIG